MTMPHMRMIMCALALIALTSMSCSSSKPPKATFIATLEARDAADAAVQTSFMRGETTLFRLRIRWTGRSPTTAGQLFPSLMVANSGGEQVWSQSLGAIPEAQEWQPGQEKTWDFTWADQHPEGSVTPAAAGRYRATVNNLSNLSPEGPQPLDFDIVAGSG